MSVSIQATEYVGFIAAAITGIALIPQAIQIWKNGNYQCISIFVYILFTLGSTMWLAYGVLLQKWPLIISNTMSMVLAGSILILKLRSGKKFN